MQPRDQRAIKAAMTVVRAINWICDHPHEPVPTSIVRPAMESFADYVLDRMHENLALAIDLRNAAPKEEQKEPEQPDSLPACGSD